MPAANVLAIRRRSASADNSTGRGLSSFVRSTFRARQAFRINEADMPHGHVTRISMKKPRQDIRGLVVHAVRSV